MTTVNQDTLQRQWTVMRGAIQKRSSDLTAGRRSPLVIVPALLVAGVVIAPMVAMFRRQDRERFKKAAF